MTLAVYAAAALAEIAGCFAFWAWFRLDKSALWLAPGMLALAAFAWSALTRFERSAVLGLYLLSITFHSTHLLLAVALLPLAVLLPVAGDGRAPRAMRLAMPILAAVVLLLAASWLGFGRLTLTPQGAPFLLARFHRETGGASLQANVRLLLRNAALATQIARAVA